MGGVDLARCDDGAFAITAGERALYEEGDLRAARRCFEAAHGRAEASGDRAALARAALGLGGIWVQEHRPGPRQETVRARQRRALALVGPRSPLALRLRIRMRGEDDYRAGEHAGTLRLLEEARAAGDPVALAEALSLAHHCLLGPAHAGTRLALASELTGVAARTGRRGDLLMGLMWRTVDLFKAADPQAEPSLRELRAALAAGDHLAVGFVARAAEVMLATRAGRFEEAEALAGACAQRGAEAGHVDAPGWYGEQLGAIRWFQGRAGELVPSLRELAGSPTLSPVDHAVAASLAVSAATAGDHRTAAGVLARLRGQNLPRSGSWLATLYFLAEAAYLLRDTGTAARARELLAPYAGLPAVAGPGVTCLGSVRHSLGMAALTTGDVDGAVAELRAAVRDNVALGHRPAAALSRHRLAQALALRHGLDDEAARRERSAAAEEARELGMMLPAGPGACRIEPHGRQWRVTLGGRRTLVADSVGMRHLAVLVARPGREVPAADLVEEDRAGGGERARIAVGKAVRRALARIAEADPVIGVELRAAVRTGARCAYLPGNDEIPPNRTGSREE
ncbi:hypothetical protein [Nonomuraea sp. NPDC049725]|uniref:hypothetical protein n=1 Tax=Nonomuraea sp. NPDC049725 TaxID=3154508 RepID=UPI0034334C98